MHLIHPRILKISAVFAVLAFCATRVPAQTPVIWSGNSDSTWSNGGNWVGGTAPANSTTANIADFSGTVTSNQPNVTANTSITGLEFDAVGGGWTIGGSGTLTIGASGINDDAQTSGTTTIDANLTLSNTSKWLVGAGGTLVVNGTASGAANMTYGSTTDTGTIELTSANSLTGKSVLVGGTILLGTATSLGSGQIELDSTVAPGTTIGSTGAALTLANTLQLGNSLTIGGTGNMTFTGTAKLNATSVTLTVNNAQTTFGAFTPPTGYSTTLIIAGSGTTIFNGTVQPGISVGAGAVRVEGGTLHLADGSSIVNANISTGVSTAGALGFTFTGANTISNTISGIGQVQQLGTGTTTLNAVESYTGRTLVSAGTLLVGSGGSILHTSGIALTGGTFQLGASNKINAAATLSLGSGAFNAAGFSQTLGTLSLTSASTLDFGADHSGTVELTFANSSALNWSGTLTLADFTVGTDVLNFGSSTGLTAEQLSEIGLNGYTATGLDSSGNVVFSAAPELPIGAYLAIGGLCLFFWRARHVTARRLHW